MINVIEKIQTLSSKIDHLYIFNENGILPDKNFLEIFSHLNEIISLLTNNQEHNKYFKRLIESFNQKKLKLANLQKTCELQKSLIINEPQQKHGEMFKLIIESCEKFVARKTNNDSSQSISIINPENNEIDFRKLKLLYAELLNCDEISDLLYQDIEEKTNELKKINESLNAEIERLEETMLLKSNLNYY